MERIAVIGAGVSGMTTAHLLKDKAKVVVFEKEGKPGGLIKCRRVNGNLFHTCGGHVFNSKRQDVLGWFWSKFNRDEEFSKADRNSVVFMDSGWGGNLKYLILLRTTLIFLILKYKRDSLMIS